MQAIHFSNVANIDPPSWDSFPIQDVIEGDPQGEVHWLRQESGGEGVLLAGVFSGQPSKFNYVFSSDETFFVLEGRVTISLDEGNSVELSPGDICSFVKGSVAVWHIHEPTKKFFVLSG